MLPARAPASMLATRLLVRDNQRITALARAGDVAAARRVFDAMPRRDVVSWNALLTALWRAGRDLPAARRLFDDMPSRNVISWNSVVAGCLAHGDLDAASAYFARAPRRNVASWNAMLAGLVRLGRMDDAWALFGEMPQRNVVSYTTMVDGLARRGEVARAREVFDAMPERNLVSWAAMITGYVENAMFDEARKLFEAMPDKNVVACTAMITGYCKDGDVESARRLFDGIPVKDVISWNAMITGYVHNGHGEEAMKLHIIMFREGVKPDHATLIAILTACSALALLRQGRSTHAVATKTMLESSTSFCNALMTMYSKCGNVGESELVFMNLKIQDIVSWNTIIAAYAQHGKYQKAIALFHEMETRGLIPNDITILSMLSACGHVGRVNDSLELFDLMSSKYAISPSAEHYACVVDILGRAGQLEKACSYIKKMPFEAERNVWGALLGASKTHGNVQLGELAAKMLVQSDSVSSGPYVMLSNIYAAAGMWGEVNRVRGQMKEKGVKKQPGYSWTEIANKVNMFVGGDASHPEMNKIISELRKISFHMQMMTDETHMVVELAQEC
ncbi:pentatricopeptide repeat-containing protein At1g56690, mitochondrial [Brachypodium distachyon]|nr:pentatricopeptide repeat-containing protein At1g56690, mitochondrial [Brachypodium distachyon]|eukprot:XP_024317634.1 pentatricopeptide repeat-containing protein At1g56690, mitochondrial [Brachypodium distachyon]